MNRIDEFIRQELDITLMKVSKKIEDQKNLMKETEQNILVAEDEFSKLQNELERLQLELENKKRAWEKEEKRR